MRSRIPRPANAQERLGLTVQDTNVENSRKRKGASPVKQPAAKKHDTSVLPDTQPISLSCVPSEELEQWHLITSETGWSPQDCLVHKLSFPKRCDAARKMSDLAAHVKRLRAVGWHLLASREHVNEQLSSLETVLSDEKAARTLEQAMHREASALAQATEEGLQERADAAEAEAARRTAQLDSTKIQLEEMNSRLSASEKAYVEVSAKLEQQEATAASLSQRLATAENALGESQKYSMQLQEYNTKMQQDIASALETTSKLQEEKAALAEETAMLRGRVAALGDALEALQLASSSNESARQNALEESGRLRADLAALAVEKNAFASEASRLRVDCEEQRKDLERFRTATGKDIAALEAEKCASAALATRTEAQAATVAALQNQVALLREQRTAAEAQAEVKSSQVVALSARVAELEVLLISAEERVREGEAVRRRLHNTILELKGNVRVFCRVRPFFSGDASPDSATNAGAEHAAVSVPEQGELAGRALEVTQQSAGPSSTKPGPPQRLKFTFDRVFGPDAGQAEVFEEASALVQSALDGYRVCIFAYGQTGSGKTYTMLGRDGEEGIIPRAARQVFETADAMAGQGWKYEMRAAMLEIYNEEIRDLLGKGPPAGRKHVISSSSACTGEDAKSGGGSGTASVSYLEWVDVRQADGLTSLLKRAMAQRSVSSTASNDQSSRSHMVFMLSVEGTNDSTGQRMAGALNLVDLAGSERLTKSGAAGDRLKETQAINKSLSALGDVFAALGAREAHVPFRNSKLTFLLQSSLSGAGKALMLCNVNPSFESAAESLCTLRFAAKVNATEIGTARRNVQSAGSGGGGK